MGRPWAWAAPPVLFLLPPLLTRAATFAWPMPEGRFDVNSRQFLIWWFSAQWQIVFNRLPMLEEFLRLFPGIYSLWLRLWGARVGSIVYWSPGLRILDRPLLDVGDRVVFGAGVRINSHVLLPQHQGRLTLAIAPVRIGADSMIGGYSLLLAGVKILNGSVTPPLKALPPFTTWEGRRRVRKAHE
jgi:hypothetical protein